MKHIKEEQTLVLVKPDGVKRGLVGEIIQRIERRGLKIVGLKMLQVGHDHLDRHFPTDSEWVLRLGRDKALKTFADYNLDPKEYIGTDNPMEVGQKIRDSLFNYMMSGPIVALVVQGIHAIDMVRKLAGHTLPFKAEMGTIRGDFSVDSPAIANTEGRAIYNIMHASETSAEAKNEIDLWFKPEELHAYSRADEAVAFGQGK